MQRLRQKQFIPEQIALLTNGLIGLIFLLSLPSMMRPLTALDVIYSLSFVLGWGGIIGAGWIIVTQPSLSRWPRLQPVHPSRLGGSLGLLSAILLFIAVLLFGVGYQFRLIGLGHWLLLLGTLIILMAFAFRLSMPFLYMPPVSYARLSYNPYAGKPLGNARLEVLGGNLKGARPLIQQTPYTIGRSQTNHLILFGDLSISRQHAEIRYEQNNYYLYAHQQGNQQYNPIYIGKDPHMTFQKHAHQLSSGDYICIGNSVILFRIEN